MDPVEGGLFPLFLIFIIFSAFVYFPCLDLRGGGSFPGSETLSGWVATRRGAIQGAVFDVYLENQGGGRSSRCDERGLLAYPGTVAVPVVIFSGEGLNERRLV